MEETFSTRPCGNSFMKASNSTILNCVNWGNILDE